MLKRLEFRKLTFRNFIHIHVVHVPRQHAHVRHEGRGLRAGKMTSEEACT